MKLLHGLAGAFDAKAFWRGFFSVFQSHLVMILVGSVNTTLAVMCAGGGEPLFAVVFAIFAGLAFAMAKHDRSQTSNL